MSNLMDEAIEALRHVRSDEQDEVARAVMQVVHARPSVGVYVPDAEEDAEMAESEFQAERREFATDEEVRAVWATYACEATADPARAPTARAGAGLYR